MLKPKTRRVSGSSSGRWNGKFANNVCIIKRVLGACEAQLSIATGTSKSQKGKERGEPVEKPRDSRYVEKVAQLLPLNLSLRLTDRHGPGSGVHCGLMKINEWRILIREGKAKE